MGTGVVSVAVLPTFDLRADLPWWEVNELSLMWVFCYPQVALAASVGKLPICKQVHVSANSQVEQIHWESFTLSESIHALLGETE